MTINYVVYDPKGGEILKCGVCSRVDLDAQGEYALEANGHISTHYIKDGITVEKDIGTAYLNKAVAVADGIDRVILSGYPAGTKVLITGPSWYEGILEPVEDYITFEIPGEYTLSLISIEQVQQEFMINAY